VLIDQTGLVAGNFPTDDYWLFNQRLRTLRMYGDFILSKERKKKKKMHGEAVV
jgi:hypothetical protein